MQMGKCIILMKMVCKLWSHLVVKLEKKDGWYIFVIFKKLKAALQNKYDPNIKKYD